MSCNRLNLVLDKRINIDALCDLQDRFLTMLLLPYFCETNQVCIFSTFLKS